MRKIFLKARRRFSPGTDGRMFPIGSGRFRHRKREKGKESFFLFSVPRDSLIVDPGFPTLMLAVMGARYNIQEGGMTCKVGLSKDGLNHFSLLQK